MSDDPITETPDDFVRTPEQLHAMKAECDKLGVIVTERNEETKEPRKALDEANRRLISAQQEWDAAYLLYRSCVCQTFQI